MSKKNDFAVGRVVDHICNGGIKKVVRIHHQRFGCLISCLC